MLALILTLGVVVDGACPGLRTLKGEIEVPRFSLTDLEDDFGEIKHEFDGSLAALGILAIDVPGFEKQRSEALTTVHECLKDGDAAAEETFGDGTVRRSLATTMNDDLNCAIDPGFRGTVHRAVRAFATRLGQVYDIESPLLLKTKNDDEKVYDSVLSILENGQHLEHFHSYSGGGGGGEKMTIDVHTDQGLFIAFVQPEYFLTNEKASFWIELEDGSRMKVPVDDPTYGSSIFFALGDGVEQFMNDHLGGAGPPLRPCPHALQVKDGGSRTWYGLMVLPPDDAVSPSHGLTYAHLRDLAVLGEDMSMGCSRKLYARELAATSCEANQLFCWARCMDPFDHWGEPVSKDICHGNGFMYYNCTDPHGQVSAGSAHGDYYPGCTDFQHETPVPTISPPPDTCDFDAAVKASEAEYFGKVHFEYGGRPWAPLDPPYDAGYLYWNVAEDGSITMKHLFPGRLGWSAVGIANPSGDKNGMHGAPIVMGIESNNEGNDVDAYIIDLDKSAFRWWNTPITSSDLTQGSITESPDQCLTEMTWTISTFGGDWTLDVAEDACNTLIWGVSTDTKIAYDPTFLKGGYHEARGHAYINFNHPQGTCGVPLPSASSSSSSSKKKSNWSAISTAAIAVAAVVMALLLFAVLGYAYYKKKQVLLKTTSPPPMKPTLESVVQNELDAEAKDPSA